MTSIAVLYGSRHGATQGIAERIGEMLKADGLEVQVHAADRAGDIDRLDEVDAFVVGSGVYMGSWLKEAVEFLERDRALLAQRPVWLFSSGPLVGSTKDTSTDPITDALGPEDGPGSGGRKKIEALSAVIQPRDHAVFFGAFDPTDGPKSLSERVVRMMPAAKDILPPGDFREWDKIEAWAHGIAAALKPAAVSV